MAKSIADYIFRWLELRYVGKNREDEETKTTEMTNVEKQNIAKQLEHVTKTTFEGHEDAPPCPSCGAIMVRNGACYKCLNCGDTSGCS